MPSSTRLFRCTLPSGVVVSTVRIGRGGRYETAYIVGGVVSDSEVTTSKGEAEHVHDLAAAVALYPSSRDPRCRRTEALVRLLDGATRDREETRGLGPADVAAGRGAR